MFIYQKKKGGSRAVRGNILKNSTPILIYPRTMAPKPTSAFKIKENKEKERKEKKYIKNFSFIYGIK